MLATMGIKHGQSRQLGNGWFKKTTTREIIKAAIKFTNSQRQRPAKRAAPSQINLLRRPYRAIQKPQIFFPMVVRQNLVNGYSPDNTMGAGPIPARLSGRNAQKRRPLFPHHLRDERRVCFGKTITSRTKTSGALSNNRFKGNTPINRSLSSTTKNLSQWLGNSPISRNLSCNVPTEFCSFANKRLKIHNRANGVIFKSHASPQLIVSEKSRQPQ